MAGNNNNSGRGLQNADEETKQRVAHEGGEARKAQGADYSEMGQKGGSSKSTQSNSTGNQS